MAYPYFCTVTFQHATLAHVCPNVVNQTYEIVAVPVPFKLKSAVMKMIVIADVII
jgi:hypothetical protein